MVDYSPLWDTMQKRKITQYTLLKDKVLDNHTLDRLKKGQNITLVTLERICKQFPSSAGWLCGLHAQRCRIIYR